jgi:hypothetical protein
MTSWGSLPTGTRAITFKLEGSTMARVWSCFERTSNAVAGVSSAKTELMPSNETSRKREVSRGFIIRKHTPLLAERTKV